MVLLLALSLQDQVEKYGSYVGIAAFFGLAVLSLLYFAQAREVKRLREWAGRAPERAREVEERAIAQAEAARRQPAPAARPVAQPVAAATAAGGRSGTVSPAVPAGAATAVVERPEDEEEPVVYGPPTEDGKGPVPAIEPPPTDEEDEPDQPDADEDERDEEEPVEEEPVAAAPETNGAPPPGAKPPAIPRPSTAAAAAGVKPAAPGPSVAGGDEATAAGGDAPSPAASPAGGAAAGAAAGAVAAGGTGGVPPKPAARPVRPAAAQLRQTTSSASPRRPVTMPPRRPGTPPPAEPSGGHRGRSYAIAGGVAAVVVALGVLAATQFLGNDDKPTTPNQAASPTPAATDEAGSGSNSGGGSSSAPTSRADTTVAVFNGTTIGGLAASTADKLRSSGYKRGTTGDYTDQQRASSTVFYTKAARRQAREIGRELNISELRVMDAETQALAQNADVAVVVGSDKAP